MSNFNKKLALNIGYLTLLNTIMFFGFDIDFKFIKLIVFDVTTLSLTQIYTYMKNKLYIEI